MNNDVKNIFENQSQNQDVWICPECETENNGDNSFCLLCNMKKPLINPINNNIPSYSYNSMPAAERAPTKPEYNPPPQKHFSGAWIAIIIVVLVGILIIIASSSKSRSDTNMKSTGDNHPNSVSETSDINNDVDYLQSVVYENWMEEEAKDDVLNHGGSTSIYFENSWIYEIGSIIWNEYDDVQNVMNLGISIGPDNEGIADSDYQIFTDQTEVTIPIGQSVMLLVSTTDSDLYDYSFNCSCVAYNPDLYSEWGQWINNNSCELTLTGLTESKGYVRFYLNNGDVSLAYCDVYVSVC